MAYQFSPTPSQSYLCVPHAAFRVADWVNFGCLFNADAASLTGDRTIMWLSCGEDGYLPGYQLKLTSGKPQLISRQDDSNYVVTLDDAISTGTWYLAMCSILTTGTPELYISCGGVAKSKDSAGIKVPSDTNQSVFIGTTFSGHVAEAFVLGVGSAAADETSFSAANTQLRDGWRVVDVAKWRNYVMSYWPLMGGLQDVVGGYSLTVYNTPVESAHPRILG